MLLFYIRIVFISTNIYDIGIEYHVQNLRYRKRKFLLKIRICSSIRILKTFVFFILFLYILGIPTSNCYEACADRSLRFLFAASSKTKHTVSYGKIDAAFKFFGALCYLRKNVLDILRRSQIKTHDSECAAFKSNSIRMLFQILRFAKITSISMEISEVEHGLNAHMEDEIAIFLYQRTKRIAII